MTESLKVTEAFSAAGSTHPRVSIDDIKSNIVAEHYFTAAEAIAALGHPIEIDGPLDLLTICVLLTRNGFTIIGKSAPASPENFDVHKGRVFAYEDAVKQLWPLMGYALRERLHADQELLASKKVLPFAEAKTYIGTKVIHAAPMSRAAYNELRGWTLPADENGDDDGYLVEYTDRVEDPPHVAGFGGYVSWSPKDVFDRAYRRT